ncbi:hypothetical protein BDW75DRAFT_237486 [Aspergillus navahoensis]
MQRLLELYQTESDVDLNAAFAAVTANIITFYSYGESSDLHKDEAFHGDVRDAIMETEDLDHASRLFSACVDDHSLLVFAIVKPATAVVAGIQERVVKKSANANWNAGLRKEGRTMFDALTEPKPPARERTLSRTQDEGMILLSGGTEPTANALTVAAFRIKQKEIWANMRAEIGIVESAGEESLFDST